MSGPDYDVYSVIEAAGDGQRDYWQRLGSAWRNRDGSINVQLNALPVNARLQLREPRDDEERSGHRSGGTP